MTVCWWRATVVGVLGDGEQEGRPALGARGAGDLGEVGRAGCEGDGRGCFAEPADEIGDRLLVGLGLLAEGEAALAQPLLDVLEAAGAEELLEDLVTVLGAGSQEGLELALRQHRDLAELVEVETNEVADEVAGLVEPGRAGRPGAVDALADRDGGLLGGHAGAAELGALPGGRARDPEPAAGQRRLERDLGGDSGLGLVGAQPLGGAAVAGHVAVQREADGVEHAGLAGPRGAAEQEQPGRRQGVEVDVDGAAERAERGDPQVVEPHSSTLLARRSRGRPGRGRGSRRRRHPGAARPRRRWPACRAARGRSRGRWRGRPAPADDAVAWSRRRRRSARSSARACAGTAGAAAPSPARGGRRR